uniref:Uncharacterized protein n=1 Tax=Populus alba TaxID=43335 RepID=A0A4U5QYZ0_POPAL|nr:hypothetical protein D5086_0000023070 [Populus alba]
MLHLLRHSRPFQQEGDLQLQIVGTWLTYYHDLWLYKIQGKEQQKGLEEGTEKKTETNTQRQRTKKPRNRRTKTLEHEHGDHRTSEKKLKNWGERRRQKTQEIGNEKLRGEKSRGTTQRRGAAPPSPLSLHLRTEGDRI